MLLLDLLSSALDELEASVEPVRLVQHARSSPEGAHASVSLDHVELAAVLQLAQTDRTQEHGATVALFEVVAVNIHCIQYMSSFARPIYKKYMFYCKTCILR